MTCHRFCDNREAKTAFPSGASDVIPVNSVFPFAQPLVFCVLFCMSLLVLLCFFYYPLQCLSFDLRLLIIPLASSNFSCCTSFNMFCFHIGVIEESVSFKMEQTGNGFHIIQMYDILVVL